MRRLRQVLIGGALSAAALLSGTPARATNTPADGTVTVTPVADVSLSLSATTYAFGNISVNTSTNSATALTLSNNGQVSVTVDKRITNESSPAGWTAGTSAGTDTYVLYATTATARPAVGDFTDADHRFGALNNVTALKGTTGGTPVITPTGGSNPSVSLWFKLVMPTAVSNLTSREITVRFTGTAQ